MQGKHEEYKIAKENTTIEKGNDRTIEQVLLAISKGNKVTPDEKKRAMKYEQNKRRNK